VTVTGPETVTVSGLEMTERETRTTVESRDEGWPSEARRAEPPPTVSPERRFMRSFGVRGSMPLADIIDRVERRERCLTLVSPPSRAVVDAVERTFAPQGIRVDVEEGTDRPTILIRDGDDVVSAVPITRDATLEAATDALTSALSRLDRTTFSSSDRRGMYAATREIEDRAWRVRRGRLHAGFQHVRALAARRTVYTRLGRALDVHAYAAPTPAPGAIAPAVRPPDLGDVAVHLESAPEIERSWFVVYDGGGRAVNKCALLAEERADRQFSGFLTYAPDLVDEIEASLTETYLTGAR
jgi:DICT domain-containing protein